jgi:hypothetical protein
VAFVALWFLHHSGVIQHNGTTAQRTGRDAALTFVTFVALWFLTTPASFTTAAQRHKEPEEMQL